jgi:small subunit ribosomal protein S20
LAIRHKSAIKRHRQDLKREERNRAVRTRTRHVVRELRETIAGGDADSAATKLREVVQTLSKAATKGVLHRNSASRRIARLSRQVQALKS